MEKRVTEKPLGQVNYLRLSITDRCNLRCFYCTPADEWQKLPAPEILRYEEMLHLARVAVSQGIRKIRVLTNNPKKVYGLDGFGLTVTEEVPIRVPPGEHNRRYLETKKLKMGHKL